MKPLRNIVVPLFLALLPAVVSILALPFEFKEYQLELIKKHASVKEFPSRNFYNDLDQDGNSERIQIGHNQPSGVPNIKVSNHKNIVVQQVNFDGEWLEYAMPLFADINKNGLNEVYAFAFHNDSLRLFGMELDLKRNWVKAFNKTICALHKNNGQQDWQIRDVVAADLNNDGYKEIVFAINTSFTKKPRAVFAWDVVTDSLFSSPFAGFSIKRMLIKDNDQDGNEEIYLETGACRNINASDSIPYRDNQNWLVVLNHRLDFMFEPVGIPKYQGDLQAIPFRWQSKPLILTKQRCKTNDTIFYRFDLYDYSGKFLQRIHMDHPMNISINYYQRHLEYEPPIIFDSENQSLNFLSQDLRLEKITRLKSERLFNTRFYQIDLGNDGEMDHLFFDGNNQKGYLYRHGFKKPVEFDMEKRSVRLVTVGYLEGQDDRIFINNNFTHYIYAYQYNPYYFLKYPMWLAVYLFWVGFFMLILKYQRNRVQQAYQMQNRINELQMMTMRNQLNPHFILNSLNSISTRMYKNELDEANNLLTQFSKLMRQVMLNADKRDQLLVEELKFVENYLLIEQKRYKGLFNFEINYDAVEIQEIRIPCMVLQTHVENAIKHGLRNCQYGGLLKVDVLLDKDVQIIIEDNGMGRKKARMLDTKGSGVGIKASEEILKIYESIKKIKIRQEIIDLYDDQGLARGTKVIIALERE